MTFQELLEKKNGEYIEVAGSTNAKNQCVDLANFYLKEVCGHPIVEWTNACDFPSKIKDMEWIPNDEITDLPKEGDIIIWSNKVGGGAGHIAIFISGTTAKFKSFDQNWPVGSPCHVQDHTYSNVVGWLRPKVINSTPPEEGSMTDEDKRILNVIHERGLTEGDIRKAADWIRDNVVENLEIKISNDLKSKCLFLSELIKDETWPVEKIQKLSSNDTLGTVWQSLQENAKKSFEKINTNFELYRNKNNEFNAMKYMAGDLSHLISFAWIWFKKKDLNEYLKTELPKVIDLLKKNDQTTN